MFRLTLVDVSSVSTGLFITGAVFILLIFSLLSFGILQMFQQRRRVGWYSFAGAVVSSAAFWLILDQWFV
ncbi:hypothetical protein [Paenibacillus spongiae]|uniref:DUF2759 family protein n=1 Tax=Paenibacillus spongiae TaxID=2909671 RepID=A0ABY5S202_9BACL|nr:hypothetical protein [Paenibacillus spongiae]UVI27887.1 hypothetical protein L1F29_20790 [Paenibacillus spongiae]